MRAFAIGVLLVGFAAYLVYLEGRTRWREVERLYRRREAGGHRFKEARVHRLHYHRRRP